MIEPITGLNALKVGNVVLARKGQILWWEEAGLLQPSYPRSSTESRWLFHDLVAAMVLRTLLTPVPCQDIVPKVFRPITDEVREQMFECRQILGTYSGDIRDLTLYFGVSGEILATNGKMVFQGERGFFSVAVQQVESLAYGQLRPKDVSKGPMFQKWWTVFMSHSEQMRGHAIQLPDDPLLTLSLP